MARGSINIGGKDYSSDIATKAPLASPALTGTPTAPTATKGTENTQIATTAFVMNSLGGSRKGNLKYFTLTVQDNYGVKLANLPIRVKAQKDAYNWQTNQPGLYTPYTPLYQEYTEEYYTDANGVLRLEFLSDLPNPTSYQYDGYRNGILEIAYAPSSVIAFPTLTNGAESTATLTLTKYVSGSVAKVLESATIKFTNPAITKVNVFLVGGGGGGGDGTYGSNIYGNTGGGGGGYTTKATNVSIVTNTQYPAIIGAGGVVSGGSRGGTTTFLGYSAGGGYCSSNTALAFGTVGGNGGCGGGGGGGINGGNGGTNGGNGAASYKAGGTGQGTTTLGFDGIYYAGGGGGGGYLEECSFSGGTGGTGGATGGGNGGGYGFAPVAGTANTGGGGGGASNRTWGDAKNGGSGLLQIQIV